MRYAIFFSLLAASAFAARTEVVTLDLARPKQSFALSFTDATSTTVEARLRYSGADFDPTGWTGLLWFGTSGGAGITLTNATAATGLMTWDVTAASTPTNGRYSVQIFGYSSGRLEEWGKGALTVSLSPSLNSLPADWQTNSAWRLAINAEALLRISGDAAGTQHVESVRSALLATNVQTLAATSNALATAVQTATGAVWAASYAGLTNEAAIRAAADASFAARTNDWDGALQAEADTLADVLGRGFEATQQITLYTGASTSVPTVIANYYQSGLLFYDVTGSKAGTKLSLDTDSIGVCDFNINYQDFAYWRFRADGAPTNRVVASLDDIAAIPRVPTNAVSGWLLYDAGSNQWLRVTVSNYAFTVWEVSP
jgi:hypothetical protein